MAKVIKLLVMANDLGTSATTGNHCRVRDTYDNQGTRKREKLGSVLNVTDWPGCIEGATGNVCVPTDLIYHRQTGELLYWGYEASRFLDDPLAHDRFPDSDVFLVETIKLLLPDLKDTQDTQVSSASERYRDLREGLIATLKKTTRRSLWGFSVQGC